MLDARRLEFSKNVFHARTFKLEHAIGEAGRKERVRLLIIERQRVHVQIDAFVLFEHS